jgi:hypothetical protein
VHRVHPTLRALRDDLKLPIPSAQVPLDTISHPLLDKASDRFADPGTAHERIRAIDDVVLFKVKVQRWRGAVWIDEHASDFPGFRLGVQIRADDGNETYVAIRITGSVPSELAAMILSRVPGCEADGWFPEYTLPERHLLPAEQAWSNIMDPKAAAELLTDS